MLDGGNSVGQILYIDADDVVINGLEVKSATGDIVRQSNPHSGTVFKYSIIHDGNGDEGVQLKKCMDCTLEFNYVYDIATPGDALNISDGSANGMIRFNELHDISNITVVDNNLRDNTLDPGKWGDPGAIMIGTAVNASTVHVNNNNITNNSVNGVTNKATALLDAKNNWWSAADGPSGAGPGSGEPRIHQRRL